MTPLFHRGLYTSPDGENHLVRTAHFTQIVKSGNLFPGWVDELNNHQGYPIFYFTYPLPYYLNTTWVLLGVDLVTSIKITLALSTLVGCIFLYKWLEELTQDKSAALLGGVMYVFTPYRFVDLYVRLALGEIVFLGLIPIAFYFLEMRKKAGLAAIVALLVVSHLQFSAIFLGILAGYALIRKISIRFTIISILLGMLLSAFFWLPATTLLKYTTYAQTNQFVAAEHLPTLNQLVYSPWGFGFSRPGPNDDMSFQVGFANWLILGLSVVALVKYKDIKITYWMLISVIVLTAIAFPWGFWNMEIFKSLQFPWRLLAVVMLATSVLAGLVLAKLPTSYRKWLLIVVSILAIYANRNHLKTNQPQFELATDEYFLQAHTTTTATVDEFRPLASKETFSNNWIITFSRGVSALALGILLVKQAKRLV